MEYIFVLGSNPTLSLAEIAAVLGMNKDYSMSSRQISLIKAVEKTPSELINRLAGVVKIGRINGTFAEYELNELAEFISEQISLSSKKIRFGISIYSLNKPNLASKIQADRHKISQLVKQKLKEKGYSSRYIKASGAFLSSAAVGENKILSSGGEILLIASKNGLLVGKTEVIQDYAAWSHRDYDKPCRDAKRGMLPPKLARSMINLALAQKKPDQTNLLDPFCGVGTVLMEAALLGISKMLGNDIDEAAIDQAETNLNWFEKEFNIDVSEIELMVGDATKINSALSLLHKPTKLFDCIVTEPFLGPPQKGNENKRKIDKQIKQLTRLYSQAFASIAKIMKPGARFTVVLPVFRHGTEANYLPFKKIIKGSGLSLVKLLPASIPDELNKKTPHNGILYQRPGQRVGREIICLKGEGA